MKKIIKWGAIILGVLILIGFLLPSPDEGTTAKNETSSTPSVEKTWATVATLKGSGMKNSAHFNLTGGDVRIKYDYKSSSDMMGMLAVYVLEKGVDLMKDGGIPDVMTDQIEDKGESYVNGKSGEHYISVNGTGKWTVTIEELK